MSRSELLGMPGVNLTKGPYEQSGSPTKSVYAAGWQEIYRWDTFVDDIKLYFGRLSRAEWNEPVDETLITGRRGQIRVLPEPENEEGLKNPLWTLYHTPHNSAIISDLGIAPHSEIAAYAASIFPFIGDPDFVFVDKRTKYKTGVIELKSFWHVTKEEIDKVLNGTTPASTSLIQYRRRPINRSRFYGGSTNVRVSCSERKAIRGSDNRQWLVLHVSQKPRQVVYDSNDRLHGFQRFGA
jgi:hypothetical protein